MKYLNTLLFIGILSLASYAFAQDPSPPAAGATSAPSSTTLVKPGKVINPDWHVKWGKKVYADLRSLEKEQEATLREQQASLRKTQALIKQVKSYLDASEDIRDRTQH